MEHGNYLYPLLFLIGGLGFTGMNFVLGRVLGGRHQAPEKDVAYECGEFPIGRAWVQYNVRYVLYAIMFVLFDVEVVFLFPWAVGFRDMLVNPAIGIYAFLEMLIFLGILILAILYAWRKGAMEWL